MKYRLLILLLAAAAVALVVALVNQKRSDQRAVYQGRHAVEWAAEFYPNFDPRGTNAAIQAFQVLSSNAVPALRSQLKSRTPLYETFLVQNAKWLPRSTRPYLFGKIKPGQSVARRVSAARALGVIGPAAREAIPALIAALQDPAGEVRWAAGQALSQMGDPAIIALATAATNADVTVRHTAVYALGEAGTNAASAAAVLFECSLDPNQSVHASAVYSLSRIGPAGVLPALEACSSENPARRAAAATAIRAMNRPPRHITRTLLEFATNPTPKVRRQSLAALQALPPDQPQIVATYVRALHDLDPGVRCAAAQAISQSAGWTTNVALSEAVVRTLELNGSLGSNIVVRLSALLLDPEPSVRTAAQRALMEIQTATPK